MPFASQAQMRMAYAKAGQNPKKARRGGEGMPADVAKKFVKDSAGQDVSKLPERVKK